MAADIRKWLVEIAMPDSRAIDGELRLMEAIETLHPHDPRTGPWAPPVGVHTLTMAAPEGTLIVQQWLADEVRKYLEARGERVEIREPSMHW